MWYTPLVDWVAAVLAGCGAGRRPGADGRPRRRPERVATVVGTDLLTSVPFAALANGYASHVLDYDDVFNPVPTTVYLGSADDRSSWPWAGPARSAGPTQSPATSPASRPAPGLASPPASPLRKMYVGGCSSQQPNMTQTTAAGSTNSAGCLPSPLSGEKDARLAQQNFDFDKALTTSGVVHRFCTGTGTHSWPFWQTDMVDILRYAYGTGPDTSQCDNA